VLGATDAIDDDVQSQAAGSNTLASPPSSTSMISTGWEKTVETLVLNHRQISRIEPMTLEQFVNLRKLQLVDNGIVRIEGLGRCKLLEELSLEKNKITQIEGINHLRYLKKLDLGRNRIRRIDGLN
jgi:Leucine-rich repeat (LRR) protein